MTKLNKIYNEDCLEGIKRIPDKSVGLAIYDAPYFSTGIKEVGDKQWKKEGEYVDWCIGLIKETERVLKDNGSFYWFHNDINIMVEILYRIKKETGLKLKNQITWDKLPTHNNFSRVIKTYGSNRKYGQTFTEYCYYFTIKERFSEVILDSIKKGVSRKDLSMLELSKNGKPTGWLSNKISGSQMPTENQWAKICNFLNRKFDYRELLPVFNQPFIDFKGTTIEQQKELIQPYSNTWNFERDDVVVKQHLTPKPLKMIKHIISVSSNEGDTILDCFMGSGTTAIAAINTNRNYIGFELDKEYFDIANKRIEEHSKDLNKNIK